MTPTFFPTPSAFRTWLKKNYRKETELLVGFYKVGSGKASMSWPESVDQALCFGWIDGVRKSLGEESYTIRFSPRKPGSIWSAINIKKIEELTNAGLMMPEGLQAFSLRTEAKSKIYAHEKDTVKLDTKYERLFKKNKTAWIFFNKQAPSYKKVMTNWIMSAKQEATRVSRLEKTIVVSEQGKRMQ